jgi:hypothetical protein
VGQAASLPSAQQAHSNLPRRISAECVLQPRRLDFLRHYRTIECGWCPILQMLEIWHEAKEACIVESADEHVRR